MGKKEDISLYCLIVYKTVLPYCVLSYCVQKLPKLSIMGIFTHAAGWWGGHFN